MNERIVGYFGESGDKYNAFRHGVGIILETDPPVRYGHPSNNVTTNVAGYQALALLLRHALDFKVQQLLVRGSSQLIIEQMRGKWRVRDAKLQPLFAKAQQLFSRFGSVEFELVARQQNKALDIARKIKQK